MIQRIQTLYLLIASVLVGLSLFLPLAYFGGVNQFYELYALGLRSVDGADAYSTIYMFVLFAISAVLPFVTIFLFKNRMLQVRLCAMEVVLLIGANVMMGIYFFLSYRVFSDLEISTQGFKPALMLPFASILFVVLAARAIFKDELLIRSVDRIR